MTSALVTDANKKAAKLILNQVSCIHYLVQFRKDKADIWALINSGSEVNAMTSAYAKNLGLQTQKTNIRAQKIDGSSLDTFRMVIANL